MTTRIAPRPHRRRTPLAIAGLLLTLFAAALVGACGGEKDAAPEAPDVPEATETTERVDPERLAEDMRERANDEINAGNLDAELEKLEEELSSDTE